MARDAIRAVLLLAGSGRPARQAADALTIAVVWMILLLTAAGSGLCSWLRFRNVPVNARPSAGAVVITMLMRSWWGRLILFGCWAFIGWHLFARYTLGGKV
jgi:Family of unknown function (DUF6186)